MAAVQRSVDWRGGPVRAYQRTDTRLFETLGASGWSQLASTEDSGGVSAVIGTSDLDGLTVVSGHALRQSAITLIAFRGVAERC